MTSTRVLSLLCVLVTIRLSQSACSDYGNDCSACSQDSDCRFCLLKSNPIGLFIDASDGSLEGACVSRSDSISEVNKQIGSNAYCGLLVPDFSEGVTCQDVKVAATSQSYRQTLLGVSNTQKVVRRPSDVDGRLPQSVEDGGSFFDTEENGPRSPLAVILPILLAPVGVACLALCCCFCIPCCRGMLVKLLSTLCRKKKPNVQSGGFFSDNPVVNVHPAPAQKYMARTGNTQPPSSNVSTSPSGGDSHSVYKSPVQQPTLPNGALEGGYFLPVQSCTPHHGGPPSYSYVQDTPHYDLQHVAAYTDPSGRPLSRSPQDGLFPSGSPSRYNLQHAHPCQGRNTVQPIYPLQPVMSPLRGDGGEGVRNSPSPFKETPLKLWAPQGQPQRPPPPAIPEYQSYSQHPHPLENVGTPQEPSDALAIMPPRK